MPASLSTFLIVTPGITIRDRFALLPNDPENYYRQRDIVPPQLQDQLGQAKIIIINYHAFQLRERSRPARSRNPFRRLAAERVRRNAGSDGPPRMSRLDQQEEYHRLKSGHGAGLSLCPLITESRHQPRALTPFGCLLLVLSPAMRKATR